MIILDSVGSTNDYIKQHHKELEHFDVVYTSNQTNGRGRTSHIWESEPNKNATFSLLIKNDKIINKFSIVSIITGVIISDYLINLGIEDVTIKWPNDVYVSGKKICGILLEGSIPDFLLIGIGINVNQTNFNGIEATSIKKIIGMKIDPKLVAIDISDALKSELNMLGDNLEKYIDIYKERDYLLNKTISFTYNNENLVGKALGINLDGSLKVQLNNKIININANEVNLVRGA